MCRGDKHKAALHLKIFHLWLKMYFGEGQARRNKQAPGARRVQNKAS